MNSEASAQNPAEDVETHPGHHRNKWWEKEKNPESYISSGGVETNELKINLMFTRDVTQVRPLTRFTEQQDGGLFLRKGGFGSCILQISEK